MNASSLTTIKRQNIYEQVIDYLKQYIIANNLGPGDPLPTEAVLTERLKVSRLTVREALKVLESLGMVETRTRGGTRLKSISLQPLTDHLRFLLEVEKTTLREMAGARLILETAIMSAIVVNADEDDLGRIDAAVEQMRRLVNTNQPALVADADMAFHLALFAATRNRAIEAFGVMLQEFFSQVRKEAFLNHAAFDKSLREHTEIANALRARDVARAQALMHEHLSVYGPFGPSASPQSEPRGKSAEGVSGEEDAARR